MSKIRKAAGSSVVAAVAVGVIAAASAMAQNGPGHQGLADTDFSVAVKATPSKAGTKQHPQGVAISATSTVATKRDLNPPIVTGIDLLLGRGFSLNGERYVTCSKRVLDRHGPKGCPKQSIMGGVISTARAGAVDTKGHVTLVNGNAEQLFAYTSFDYPARVRKTIVLTTADLTGRWGYKGTFRVPKSLQVIAGIPIQTTRMELTLGGKPYAKDYITTSSCPKGGWSYRVTTRYRYDASGRTDQGTVSGTIPCSS